MDQDKIRIPAFMRKSQLKRKAARKILFTALDRKQAELLKKKRKVVKQRRSLRSPSALGGGLGRDDSILALLEPDYHPEEIEEETKPSLKYLGQITHFFDKIDVGVIELNSTLKEGDIILINRNKQLVDSMEINRRPVKIARRGDDIGLKLNKKAQVGDKVFLVNL